ncbi:TPA: 23S rRNA (adenine(2058)-N(6))-methyltransferase Erm(B), partial [Streptococcus pneumoniae]|nr:23S rRNA (adenine(2058)-N(6))-methyltransferase Erm(B) [Streptococcus pneumoniae]HEV2004856.1 23S rRNA (adenine(2058)-N(6))-methyltransferase Erm(B) [Streptococcus pneumoniae]HEV2145584.1 23S rRNA (adenine(2058)-N(6))-methyltransferase Erm(B) [Streptococcus pneumoniae]HEV3338479.1 23S rRNA (adenine(2058)-N(6))-methyltransferase Erm(B) [Streptococcus pneumoniae]HEW9940550.1 23S rRNA (adenine(2058)-N(6))-methyltransferase Erm(B) [Streptococcus pneumoniae]
KWVNREYRQLFTKNQFHQAMKYAKVNDLSTVTYEQVLSIFNSYLLFNGRKFYLLLIILIRLFAMSC